MPHGCHQESCSTGTAEGLHWELCKQPREVSKDQSKTSTHLCQLSEFVGGHYLGSATATGDLVSVLGEPTPHSPSGVSGEGRC